MITIKSMRGIRFATVLVAVGFSGSAMAAVQVDLQVDGSRLVVAANNAQCAGESIDCIDVKHGTNPHLFFNLSGACGNNGPVYRLAAFRIGMQSKVWPTPSTPLPTHIASDFNANPQTGYVNLTVDNNQLSNNKIKLKDHNRSTYTVFYDVTAAHCTDMTAGDIHLDPKIKNGGNN